MSEKTDRKPGKDGRIPLTIRLKPGTYQALEEKARTGFSKNLYVQELLDKFLNRVNFDLRLRGEDSEEAWDGVERRKAERRKSG